MMMRGEKSRPGAVLVAPTRCLIPSLISFGITAVHQMRRPLYCQNKTDNYLGISIRIGAVSFPPECRLRNENILVAIKGVTSRPRFGYYSPVRSRRVQLGRPQSGP